MKRALHSTALRYFITMSRSNTEDWQRRKSFLIRDLFFERPLLSPIPEEQNSSAEFFHHNDYEVPYRSHSPLPPLIIEKEPNRHDEPEEFYEKLEIKMKRLYRKLFIEGKSDVSSDDSRNSDLSYDLEKNCHEMNETDDVQMNIEELNNNVVNSNGYFADQESSSEISLSNNNFQENSHSNSIHIEDCEKSSHSFPNDDQNHEKLANSYKTSSEKCFHKDDSVKSLGTTEVIECSHKSTEDSELIGDESVTNRNKSNDEEIINTIEEEIDSYGEEADNGDDLNEVDDGPDYIQITTKAIVHVDGAPNLTQTSQIYDESESLRSIMLPTRTAVLDTHSREVPLVTEPNVTRQKLIAKLEERFSPQNFSTPREDESIVSYETLEEMRSCSINQNKHQSFEHITGLQKNSSSFELCARRLSEISQESENTNYSETSSNKTTTSSDNIRSTLSSIINYSDHIAVRKTRKRKISENVSTQTEKVTMWDKLSSNFFVGTPKLYRLCTCVNHACC